MNTTTKMNTGTELQIGIKTSHRYTSKEMKHLSHRFMHNLFNYYQGLFVLDKELNVLDENGKFFVDREKPGFDRIREIIQFKIVIGDRDFFDNSNLNENLEQFGKCYTYMVDKELHSGKGLINSHPNYPGVRIFKDYEEMVSYIEAQNFQNQLIYVTGFDALRELKYLINKIEIMVLENSYNENNDKIFPITELVEFMGFSELSDSTKQTFTVHDMSPEYKEHIENENKSEFFSDYIKMAKSTISRKQKRDLKNTKVKYEYSIYRLHRQCHTGVYGIRKAFAKRIGLKDISNLRMLKIGEFFAIYDVTNMVDLTKNVYKITEFGPNMDAIGMKWGDRPHTIAITQTQIDQIETLYNLQTGSFKRECVKRNMQIQNR